MDEIAAGSGKSPAPFMLAASRVKADAVWDSNRNDKASSVLKPTATSSTRPGAKAAKLESIPTFIEPQLCRLVDRPPADSGWAHEVKFDGYRVQLRVEDGNAQLRTRNGLDWTSRFGALARAGGTLPDCIVDGEICALDHQQMPNFAALQSALSENKSDDLVLFAFDLLAESQHDLRPLPLSERKARLRRLLQSTALGSSIRYVQHFESTADTVLLSACKMHLEGIISKRLDAAYVSGRSGQWTKAKCRAGHEVVLGGWTSQAGGLRSLLAGVNKDGHLVYVGRIGTGFAATVAAKLSPSLRKLTREQSPFGGANAPRAQKGLHWLKPTLVAEIEFAGWTESGMIRQTSFKGLRHDKPAEEVIAETPARIDASVDEPSGKVGAVLQHRVIKSRASGTKQKSAPAVKSPQTKTSLVMSVNISNPDKVMWPDAGNGAAVTKLDLAHYYEAIGEWLLPHLRGRPCSLVRAPDGVSGQKFFQRHAMAGMSNLFTLVKVKGDKAPYLQLDRVEGTGRRRTDWCSGDPSLELRPR
jgi:bifunctional non-homologous end joining protein LigD